MVVAATRPAQANTCCQNYPSQPYQGYPDPEVVKKSVRRRFTAEYKLRILQEADTCNRRGQISMMLCRESLSFSHLTTWRRQREQGQLQALTDDKRGRKARASCSLNAKSEWLRQGSQQLQAENEELHKQNQQLAQRLKQAELMLDIQKKASEILMGVSLAVSRAKSNESD